MIAGEGDHRGALERRADELGLGDTVEFPGWIGEDGKWDLLRRAWAVCYTSPKEGWGISSLEAQRVGTVVVVSDAPGLRDTIVPGVTGWMAPHGDVSAVTAALERVIARPAERRRMELAAVERAAEYTWGRSVDATERILLDAAGSSPAG